MSNPRKPNSDDIARMSQAVGLVAAYDLGEVEGQYHLFARMSAEAGQQAPIESLRAGAQFAWMLLESLESTGVAKDEVLAWYGVRFANRAEELRE